MASLLKMSLHGNALGGVTPLSRPRSAALSITKPKPVIVCLGDSDHLGAGPDSWGDLDFRADVRMYRQPLTGDALASALRPAEGVVLTSARARLSADLIAQMPKLRFVVASGSHRGNVDVMALSERAIPLSRVDWGPSKDAVTEMVWTLILSAQKMLVQHLRSARNSERCTTPSRPLPMLNGKTIGLVGLGEIGQRVAHLATAFGMNVVTWSPHMTPDRAFAIGATAVSLDALLGESDIVSLHLPLLDTTRHFFGATHFASMKRDAMFVNAASAGVVDETALIHALKSGLIAQAAIDVSTRDSLSTSHPLLGLPNVMLTSYLSQLYHPVSEKLYDGIKKCLNACLDGQPLLRLSVE